MTLKNFKSSKWEPFGNQEIVDDILRIQTQLN